MDAPPNRWPNIQDRNGKNVQLFDDPEQVHINDSTSFRGDNKRVKRELGAQFRSCFSSSSSYSTMSTQKSSKRGLRVAYKRRNPRFVARHRASDVEAIAFPLGMSIAAVVAQVLERTEASWNEMPVDHLSMICASAVRESLANVFGDKFEPFARNFEKAFGSTLKTLQLVKGSSPKDYPEDHLSHFRSKNDKNDKSEMTPAVREFSSGNYDGNHCQIESRISDTNKCESESTVPTVAPLEDSSNDEDKQGSQSTVTRELSLHGLMHQELPCVSSNARNNSRNFSMISTFEKSVVEQTRANDLKAFEIGLTMRKLHLKETQLALNSDANFLEKCKLFMGFSKASFKVEKFKTQMEDTRHAELVRNCIDCLVAGLLIMSSLIIYGTYVYSYKRIMDATLSCNPSTESKSWWAISKPMASFTSGLQTLRCQVQVFSRMLFGLLIILAIGYSIFQRSAAPRQTMPVTFILLLLGVGCGVVGKFCIDTLGGNGYHWLLFWEMLCSLHFFVHMFPPFFFTILYGPILVSQDTKGRVVLFPYWMRRILFYLVVLLVFPMLCGLVPFASLREWKYHFSSLISNLLLVVQDQD